VNDQSAICDINAFYYTVKHNTDSVLFQLFN